MKFCFCVLLASAVVLATAQDAKEDYDNLDADYDSFYDYDQLKEEGEKLEVELDNLAQSDKKVKSDIDLFREKNLELEEPVDAKDIFNAVDDYQQEDNRDKPKDDEKDIPVDVQDSLVDVNDAPIDNDADKKRRDDQADYALLWGDDSVAPLPIPDAEPVLENKDIIDENQLNEDGDAFEEEIIKALDNAESFPIINPSDNIMEETKKILEETDDEFNDEIESDAKIDESKKILKDDDLSSDVGGHKSLVEDEQKPVLIDDSPIEKELNEDLIEDVVEDKEESDHNIENLENDNISSSKDEHKVIDEEDTVDKVYADLNEDLDKLLDTLDKLSDNGSDSDDKLEEVFDKLDEHFFKEGDNNVEGSEELVDDDKNPEYSDVDFEKILEDIVNENDLKPEDDAADIDLKVQLNDEMNEPNPDDAFERDVEPLPDVNEEPILYLDAIVDEPKNAEPNEDTKNNNTGEVVITLAKPYDLINAEPILFLDAIVDKPNAESIENTNNNNTVEMNASVEVNKSNTEQSIIKTSKASEFDSVDIDTLNSEELEGLVKQFSIANSDVLNVHAETFDQNVAPIHIKLNVDNPEVVTSPNYPGAYPSNNIVDWIFDGEGMGIEMNITDFLVNGALGDYLLVKPGGIDESGHEGLIFTYRLNSEKRFRFTDVDRLFVRFQSRPTNWSLMRGFMFSVKMIAPIPDEPEPIPEPEPVLEPPHSQHTIHLAAAIPQFNRHNETFRLLLADMAEEYIVANNIDPGLNTTAEVTQIISVSNCPVTWPNFALCTNLNFSISLVYSDPEDRDEMLDQEALQDMWTTYSVRDPYALRLRQMGIAEFQQPNSSVLTVWLVIASGVVISMVMLAFVLWRFSCFEDYSRMKTYSDTDSIQNEKRGLDLYPTPHQTLPPLYAENEYKWQENDDTTRVDMGGFANKSYARDMYDFDSDEEVITTTRDRNGAVTARDIYNGSAA